MVFPVVLGSGRRLFPESQDKTMLKMTKLEIAIMRRAYEGA